jgi:hypothetical protein
MTELSTSDKTNGAQTVEAIEPDAAQAKYVFRDPATGKRRAIRDMTDAELARHVAAATNELNSLQQNLMNTVANATAQVSAVNGFIAILQYESDRRRANLIMVP